MLHYFNKCLFLILLWLLLLDLKFTFHYKGLEYLHRCNSKIVFQKSNILKIGLTFSACCLGWCETFYFSITLQHEMERIKVMREKNDICVCISSHLWYTFSLSDNVIQVVGNVCIESTGQVPGLTDPVVIFSTETQVERLSQRSLLPAALTRWCNMNII